jgi:multiple sugar transport system ATP-binding protein
VNFLQGRIAGDGAPAFVTADGIRLALPAAPKAARGRDIVYGIRPEQFVIDAAAGVPAEIVVVEPTGSETQVIARLGGQSITTVFHDRISAKSGETIPLSPAAASAYLFDDANGIRIADT